MNLRDLTYLTAVADLKHFGNAAKACFVSQPTLSMQLKKLEEELGVKLIEVHNKRVIITPIGARIVERARRVLAEAEQIKELAKLAQDPFAGEIRLGVIPTLGPYLLPLIIPELEKAFPALQLLFYESKTEDLINRLRQGKLDAAFIALPVHESVFEVAELFIEPFLLLLPRAHSLAKKPQVELADLEQETLLLLEEGHCLRDQALAVCNNFVSQRKLDFEATSLETLRQMVAAGAGVTLLPALAVQSPIINTDKTVVKSFIEPVPARLIGLVWYKDTARQECLNKIAELLADFLPSTIK